MHVVTELDTFLQKFKQIWHEGLNAHLDVHSHNGQAWVSLRVQLGHAPGPLHHQLHPHFPHTPKRTRKSPSRQRRRARRAAARQECAEEEPNEETEDTVVNENLAEEANPYENENEAASDFHPSPAPSASDPRPPPVQPAGCLPPQLAHRTAEPLPPPASPTGYGPSAGPTPRHCHTSVTADIPRDMPPPLHQHTVAARGPSDVCDEICPDEQFYKYLQEQKRLREAEIDKLSSKINIGFKPKNARRPF